MDRTEQWKLLSILNNEHRFEASCLVYLQVCNPKHCICILQAVFLQLQNERSTIVYLIAVL